MTKEERSLLKALDGIVRSEEVRRRILPIMERVRADLERKRTALMAWESIPLEIFGDDLPPSIKSGWVFILRAGADTGAERHPNGHQRMMTFRGTGDMQTDIKSGKIDVESQSEIEWQSNASERRRRSVGARWISIPQNIWHRPMIPKRRRLGSGIIPHCPRDRADRGTARC